MTGNSDLVSMAVVPAPDASTATSEAAAPDVSPGPDPTARSIPSPSAATPPDPRAAGSPFAPGDGEIGGVDGSDGERSDAGPGARSPRPVAMG